MYRESLFIEVRKITITELEQLFADTTYIGINIYIGHRISNKLNDRLHLEKSKNQCKMYAFNHQRIQ